MWPCMLRKLTRRQAFQSLLGAGVLSVLAAGCGSSDDKPLLPPRQVEKTVHLALSPERKQLLGAASHVELQVGAARYRGALHTESSLQSLRAAPSDGQLKLTKAPTPTHYFNDVRFSTQAAQSYSAYAVSADGTRVLLGAGIHLASRDDQQRALRGGASSDPDPTQIMTDEDAAVWAVFNNPHVMAHDLDTAARVVRLIASMPSYSALVEAIGKFPEAVDPSDGRHAGWVYGRYRSYKNKAGQTVQITEVDWNGNDILDESGAPARVIDWELSPYTYPTAGVPVSVKELASRVTDELLAAFNNLPDQFEGVKYFRAAPVAVRGDTSSALRAGEEEESFVFSAEGRTVEHRQLSVEPLGAKYRVKLDNYLALGSLFGVSHFDESGAHLETHTLGYVPSTYYPSLTFAKGAHASSESDFARPAGTFTSNVWTCSPAMHHGDFGPNGHQVNFTGRALIAWATSLFADIVLPGVFLSMGLIGAGHASEQIVKKTIIHAINEGVLESFVDYGMAMFAGLYGEAAGGDPESIRKDLGADFVKVMIRLGEKIFLSTFFAGVVAGQLAQAGVETTLATTTPIIGWAIFAADLALTGTQLGFSTAHLVGSTIFTHGVVNYIHPLKVTMRPKDSPYFFSAARYYKLTVSAASSSSGHVQEFTPIQKVGEMLAQKDAQGLEYIDLSLDSVPIQVKLKVQITLFDRDVRGGEAANIIGHVEFDADNVTKPGEEQHLHAHIEMKPLPVDAQMGMKHDVLLTPTSASAGSWSASGAAAPVSDADPFQCAANTLCALSSVSVRQTEDKAGRIAFSYQTRFNAGTSPVMADVAMAPSTSNTPTSVKISASDYVQGGGLRSMLYSLSGTRVILSQTAGARANIYVLPESAPEVDLAAWRPSDADVYAVSRAAEFNGTRITPDGRRLLLASRDGVEVLDLGITGVAASARASLALVRPGFVSGCIAAPKAAAGFHHEAQFAVLDQGNYRVSVYDYDGAFVPYFDTSEGYLTPSKQGGNRVLLDVDVDVAGNVWVLSNLPEQGAKPVYFLDVYGKSGRTLVSFSHIEAERFALDRFNQLYSLNRQALPAGDHAAPSLSRWYPTHSA